MMKKYIFGLALMTLGLVFASCEDKLDEVPDNRTEIDTPEKLQLLLVSGYPQSVPGFTTLLSTKLSPLNSQMTAGTDWG